MKKTVLNVSIFVVLIMFASCGGSNKPSDENVAESTEKVVEEDSLQNTIMYNIPPPLEMFMLLKISGVTFDKSLLNSTDNGSKYVTSFTKAINLGTYSTDLSFCLLYKKNHEVLSYLKNIHELTTALNIDGEFIQSAAKRANANSNNLDSITEIISEFKINTNLFLSENKMNNTTALMTAGGWIEAMYILTNIAEKTQKKELYSLVADQKYSINNLIKQLEKFKSEPEIANLLAEITDISAVYNSLSATESASKASKESEMVSIGNNTVIELTDAQLKTIREKVSTLRNKLIN